MRGPWILAPLYAAVLATGAAFSVLFTGDAFGVFALSDVLASGGAFWTMLGAALVAALVGSSGRYRFVLLFPAAAVYTVIAVYGWPPVFSPERWRAFFFEIGTDVYEAGNIMYEEPIPYDLAPGLFVVLVPVVMIVATFATSATLYEESPVISVAVLGVTIGVLSTISFEDGAGPFFAVFLICAVALLLLSGAPGAGGPSRVGAPALVAGVVVVGLALAVPKAPFADAAVSSGAVDWTRIGTGGTSRLDVQADVGDYLTSGRDAELIRVQSPEPLFWRGGTLDYFDGVRWSDTTGPAAGDGGEEVSPRVPTRAVPQSVEVLSAETDLVFGAYKISAIDEEIGLSATENADGSWTLDEPFEEGDDYEVFSEIPQPSTRQLQAAGTAYPAEVRETFLQLPEDSPAVVAETARGIRRDYSPQTPYETARAVERYLVSDGGFSYNLDVSYRRADSAVEEFLGDGREGFCTQFATSMALILREMNVPSRVVYGSTEGEEVEPDEYVVTGANMHTWVEAYFPGVGWYPFDPTPGFPIPATMQANAPRPSPNALQQNAIGPENNFAQRQQAEDNNPERRQRERAQDRPETRTAAPQDGAPAWPLLLLLPALVLAAVPLAKRALVARGRPEDLYADLSGRLRDVAAVPPGPSGPAGSIADSPALTPTERLLLLAGAAGVGEDPVREFARAYSEHLYSRRPALREDGGASRPVLSAYRNALRAYERLPLWRRVLGAANPASLLARVSKSLSASKARLLKALRSKPR